MLKIPEKLLSTEDMYQKARDMGISVNTGQEKYSVLLGIYGSKINEIIDYLEAKGK